MFSSPRIKELLEERMRYTIHHGYRAFHTGQPIVTR